MLLIFLGQEEIQRNSKKIYTILIPTLMILFKKSPDLSMSIESREFRDKEKRTYYQD